MSELLQRPARRPDEWWDGYVVRVLSENGVNLKNRYMLDKIAPLVEKLLSAEVMRNAQAGLLVDGERRVFSSHLLPAWAVRSSRAACAHCAHCWHDAPYVRLNWRLSTTTHCAVHGVPLTIKCQVCSRLAFQWDLARQACACGEPYAQRPATLQTYGESASTESLTLADQEHVAMTVFLGYLLPRLACASFARSRERPPSTQEFMDRLGSVAVPKVEWLSTLWGALPAAAHLSCALNLILRLRAEELKAPTVMSVLPLWTWAQHLSGLGASAAVSVRNGWIQAGELSRGRVSASEALRLSGWDSRNLWDTVARGQLKPIRTFSNGLRQHQFSSDQVKLMKEMGRPLVRLGEPLDLGLEGCRTKIFTVSGVARYLTGPGGNKWLDYDSVRALLATLSSRATPVDAISGPKVSLGSGRVWQRFYLPVLRPLFDRLCSGEFQLWSCGDAPGFARFYIGPDAISFLYRGSVWCKPDSPDEQAVRDLPLDGGQVTWQPTRQEFARRSQLGVRYSKSRRFVQLSLPVLAGSV